MLLFVVMASIDNTVLALLPVLTARVGAELNMGSEELGLAIGLNRVVLAITAVFWGYRGDRGDRQRLMILGTLTWVVSLLPALLTVKMIAQGLDVGRATSVAALLLVIFQLGGVISIGWGWPGDRLQQRYPRSRALLAAYGFWLALPCYIVLFWLPLLLLGQRDGAGSAILLDLLGRNAWFWLALLASTLATIFQSTNAPNWFAMVAEVNLPEHRGTAFSFMNLANNMGVAIGVILVTQTFDWLQQHVVAPDNYAISLTLFLLFFLPAGLCFWLAARSMPRDIAQMQSTLRRRAAEAITPNREEDLPVSAV